MTAFPLSAIVGQQELVEALLVNAVAPEVGGVLVRGERGTAKTTAVRGLASLLPPVEAAVGEPFAFAPGERAPGGIVADDAPTAPRPAPLVELPLGTTLDRLVGSLDLARALAGEHAFEAGLLARAHRGILYVDEVNLLPDHLVDALLDAAATGVARVEREAVSVVHAARFVLVGTMNAEEGELRPQLLDRFGLGVEVGAPKGTGERAEIVRRRMAFERDREAFARAWEASELALAARIAAARERFDAVRLPERELLRIVGACAALGVDGVRGDIVTAQAARALAALDGTDEVGEAHVRRAAALALAHRRRRDPLDGRAPEPDELERALDEAGAPEDEDPPPRGGGSAAPNGAVNGGSSPGPTQGAPEAASAQAMRSDTPTPGAPARERRDPPVPAHLPLDALALDGTGVGPAGRRARTRGPGGGAIDSRLAKPGSNDIALVASLRARLLDAGTAGRPWGGGAPREPAAPREEARAPQRAAARRDGAGDPAAGAPRDATSARAERAPRDAMSARAERAPRDAVGAPAAGALCDAAGVPAAAAPRDGRRATDASGAALREHVRSGREATFVCLVVDASGSMGARRRLARVKGALIALLRDAYARRDRVAVIAFRDSAARVLVAPGAPLEAAAAALRELPTGGRTPLAAGLDAAERLIRRETLREPGRRAIAVVLTDGRVADPGRLIPPAAARLGRAAAAVHVVDTEDGPVRLGLAAALAHAAGGEVHTLTRRAA